MHQYENGSKPELERLNYNELKNYVREKGYDIKLTQSADEIRAQIKSIESPESQPETPKEPEHDYKGFEVVGEFPKHPKVKEWLESMANQYGIKLFQYNPKFCAFMLFRLEKQKKNHDGKTEWQPDPDGQLRHFEWVGLRELAVTFGESDYPGLPKVLSKYQAPIKRKIKIKQFV